MAACVTTWIAVRHGVASRALDGVVECHPAQQAVLCPRETAYGTCARQASARTHYP